MKASSPARFGLFFLPVGRCAQEWYPRVLAEAETADALGYDNVWFAEHHFDPYGGIVPSTSVMCAAVAARTRRIRLGPAIAVAPLHDALRLAEEFAMVDVLSGGRLEMGVGRGFMLHEFQRASVDWESRDSRFDACLATLTRAWTDGVDGATVLPAPIQSPPPIWIAASLNPKSFEAAGANGYGLMINPYTRTPEEIERGLDWFWTARARHGLDPDRGRVLIHAHLFVADSEKEAATVPRASLLHYLSEVDRAFMIGQPASRPKIAHFTYEQMYPARVLFGVPDHIERVIREWIARGATDFCLTASFGDLPPSLAQRTIDRFAREVIPRFR